MDYARDKYFLPANYSPRLNNSHDDERYATDEFQAEVYQFAAETMVKYGYTSVIDVGCGSGFKTVKYLGQFDTLGIETEPALSFLREKYPDRQWRESGAAEVSFGDGGLSGDLVICCDVIEHIRDPDELIGFLKGINCKHYVISTPDRDVLANHPRKRERYAVAAFGPPVNKTHVREWTYQELVMYLAQHFYVHSSHHPDKQVECQFHLCSKLLADL